MVPYVHALTADQFHTLLRECYKRGMTEFQVYKELRHYRYPISAVGFRTLWAREVLLPERERQRRETAFRAHFGGIVDAVSRLMQSDPTPIVPLSWTEPEER